MRPSLSAQDEIRHVYLVKERIHARPERPPPCGRPTRAGKACPRQRVAEPDWPHIAVEYAEYVAPACAAHVTKAERAEHDRICALTAGRLRANHLRYWASIRVECHTWAVTDEHQRQALAVMNCPGADERFDLAVRLLAEWQEGQCAICGAESRFLDHDHKTTWIRGYLCQGCNTSEGNGHREPESVFARYRDRNPASILGLQVRYYGAFTGWAVPDEPRLTSAEISEIFASVELPPLNV